MNTKIVDQNVKISYTIVAHSRASMLRLRPRFMPRSGFLKTPTKINVFFVVAGGYVAGHRWLGAWWLATAY